MPTHQSSNNLPINHIPAHLPTNHMPAHLPVHLLAFLSIPASSVIHFTQSTKLCFHTITIYPCRKL